MKTWIKWYISTLLSVSFLFCSEAQRYGTAVGIRMGNELGITVQQNLGKAWTMEGMVNSSFQNRDLGLRILGENHQAVLGKRMNLYLGVGPVMKYYGDSTERVEWGGGMIAGIELTLGRLNASLDFQPSFYFGDPVRVFEPSSGISIRYVLIKERRKEKKKHWWQFKRRKKK